MWLNVFQLHRTVLVNLSTLAPHCPQCQRRCIYSISLTPIRSRPDDNPQSKNGTIFEQIFTEASEGVAIMDSSANSGTEYLNQPGMCYLTSQNIIAAHPSADEEVTQPLVQIHRYF